jgi:hypothetical protein
MEKNAWNFIISKKISDLSLIHKIDGHRNMKILKTNGNKKCNFPECIFSSSPKHVRITRYAKCASLACSETSGNCPFSYKIEYCTSLEIAKYYSQGNHIVRDSEYRTRNNITPTKFKISDSLKTYVDSLIGVGVAPKRIYHQLLNDENFIDKPSLKWIQTYVNHQRCANGDNEFKKLLEVVKSLAKTDNQEYCTAFTIGIDFDDEGIPLIGDGSDMDPFVVGLTSLGLLQKLEMFKSKELKVMLHIDATYKITKESYPLLMLGVSDSARTFHFLGCFIISQTTEPIIKYCISAILDAISFTNDNLLSWNPDYVMSDADPAIRRACVSLFNEKTVYLSCYFHIMKNVRENIKSLNSEQYIMIMKDLNFLHNSRSEEMFLERYEDVNAKWRNQSLNAFAEYFATNIMCTSFSKWQVYHTPSGYAKTNNPVETFNGEFKKTYTQRKRFLVTDAISLIASMIKTESTIRQDVPVACKPGPVRRFTQVGVNLYNNKKFSVTQTGCSFKVMKIETDDEDEDLKNSDEYVDRNSQESTMENCQCDSFFKFGHCVHQVMIAIFLGRHSSVRRLVNRTVRRPTGRNRRGNRGLSRISEQVSAHLIRGPRGRPRSRPEGVRGSRGSRGRPRRMGPALSYE